MSRLRPGTCGEPGPYDAHCTQNPGHHWSCYDAGDDTSWNDRSPEDWQTDAPHACTDLACPGRCTDCEWAPTPRRLCDPDPRTPLVLARPCPSHQEATP